MRSRFAGWRAQENSPRLIFDRSVDEDFHVFCRMHWEAGLLGDLQYEHLRELSQTLQSAMPEPDLILFICPERRILAERVTEDSHPPLIVRRLDRQVDLYADWLSKRRNDILRLDNSACSLEAIRRMFAEDRGC